MPVIDGSQIPDFKPLPADTYNAIFEAYELKDGPKGQYYDLKFEVQDEDPEVQGRTLHSNRSIAPQSLWAFKLACIAMGADNSVFEDEFDTDELLESLLHNAVRLKVTVGEYEGRPTNNVQRILAPSFEA